MAKKKQPKQEELIEDREIKPLNDAAYEYVNIRDQRLALLREEIPLAEKVLKLMEKYDLTTYHYENVTIKIRYEQKKVQVKVKKEKEEE